jgi:Na+-driven multidrug efflux pump
MFMMPMSTMAMAVSTFTSQNYGAGKVDRVRKGIRYGFILTAAWSVVSIFVCVVFCRPLIHLITGTTDSEVLAV